MLQVIEEPGTYFWHGHAGMEKVDSLFGPLIVLPPPGAPAIAQYDDERTLLLTDNYHGEATLLAAALNRCAQGLPCAHLHTPTDKRIDIRISCGRVEWDAGPPGSSLKEVLLAWRRLRAPISCHYTRCHVS